MWLGIVIIGQLAGALISTFVIHMIWKLTHPGKGWFG
jgi:hypothetical protein